MSRLSRKNQAAIELTESLIAEAKLPEEARLNGIVNLMIYHFQREAYKTAIQAILQIGHSDQWCEKNGERMGTQKEPYGNHFTI